MSYRAVTNRRTAGWALASTAARLPVAMAPLALVFLGRGRSGGYAQGGVLAACFVAGEVAGAALLGTLLPERLLKPGTVLGLGLGALAFAGAAFLPHAPAGVVGALVFVAGASPSGSPGALRVWLTQLVAEEDVAVAFSAQSVLTEVIWMGAPPLVVGLALGVGPSTPLGLCAVSMAAATLVVRRLWTPDPAAETEQPRPAGRVPLRVLRRGWPIYLTSAAATSLMAVSELVLAPLLQYRHHPVALAGPLLTAFAVASAVASFCYGLREWPGSPRRQSLLLLLGTTAAVAVAGLARSLPWITVALLAGGCCQSVVLITRSLSLRQRLPAEAQAAGFSLMYAVQGVGYSLSAVIASFLLARANPSEALLSGVGLTLVLAVVSLAGEHRASTVPVRSPSAQQADSVH